MPNKCEHPKRTPEMADSSDLTRRQALKLALGVALAIVPTAVLAEGVQRRTKALIGDAPPAEYVQGDPEYVDADPESSGDKPQGDSVPKRLLPARPPSKYPPKE